MFKAITLCILYYLQFALAIDHIIIWQVPTNPNKIQASPGDHLVFQYSTDHNVMQLPTQSAYDNCDFSTKITISTSGISIFIIPIDASGDLYFALFY